MRKSLIFNSALAAAQFLTAGAAFADAFGVKPAAFCILVIGALQVGNTAYVNGGTTPNSRVVARFNPDNATEEAGDASIVPTGTPVVVKADVPKQFE